MGRPTAFLLTGLLALAAAAAAPALADDEKPTRKERKAQEEAIQKLPEKYRAWLEQVAVLLSDEERATFLALEKDYQRDAFIKEFWAARDPYPDTARNELKDRWEERMLEARASFDVLDDQRSRIFLSNGPPTVRIVSRCTSILQPLEVWFYRGSELAKFEFFLVFYKRWGAGKFRLWEPSEGLDALFQHGEEANLRAIADGCIDGDKLAAGIGWVAQQGMFGYATILQKVEKQPEPPKGEWVATFKSYSTDLAQGTPTFPAKIAVDFPGRHQARTVVQGMITVPVADAAAVQLGEHRSYNFALTGEVLQEGALFESFRYKFDFPVEEVSGESLAMVFERTLRPGDYTLALKLEDLNGKRFYREERALAVPQVTRDAAPPPPADAESARLLAEANAAIGTGERTIQLVEPHGDLHTGMLRFETLTTGPGIAKVTFELDGKPVLTKRKPPYSVELDLGSLPRTHQLSAVAFDAGGQEVARDEMTLNAGDHRFAVELVEPRGGKRYESSLRAEAQVQVPEGSAVERVEFYLNETLVATLYQPPFAQPILLPEGNALSYVRAVAHLADGAATEDTVFVNAPDYLDELDIEFVELYTTVVDRQGRPVEGLTQKDFSVVEDGVKQEIVRFEKVADRPIHAAVLLDVSASMEPEIERAQGAALRFFEQTVRPKDRAALVTFNDRPTLAAKFTNEQKSLAAALAGLKAERGTSLYDSLIFALYYFNGVRGQKAAVVLSDGKDESSRFGFDGALEYARRAGVTVYVVGLGEDVDRKKLARLAEETGGRAFFLQSAAELDGIYTIIQRELRSQYLVAYQSANTTGEGFRTVEVKVARSGLEAKTMRGYYP
ncbi:MAG TPA: VWA domain-containing protein [Thermoanaerobaculia bacterium]|nr:VWA domain-containing protein [Thermoanaerobaculia bacterium]